MKLNKKAMMDDLFDFLFTVFAAFFLLLFLGALFSSGEKQREEATLWNLERQETHSLLSNYLRTPTESGTIADLIVLRFSHPEKYDARYKEETQKILALWQTYHKEYAVQLYNQENLRIDNSCAGSEEICQEIGKLPKPFQLEHLGEKKAQVLAELPAPEEGAIKVSLIMVKK